MADERVHRDLGLTTPFTEGADVAALQRALNRVARRYSRVLDFELDDDGALGDKTLRAAHDVAHALGLLRSRLIEIEKQRLITRSVQQAIRDPARRTEGQKRRGERRRKLLRDQLAARPDLGAVHVTATAGPPHWGGAGDVMTAFCEPFMVKRGLALGSGKRTPAQNSAAGGSSTSDHLTTMTSAAARDFPTFFGEDDARALALGMGFRSWRPNAHDAFPVAVDGVGFRVQVLWGPLIDHDDHVHVGIRRS